VAAKVLCAAPSRGVESRPQIFKWNLGMPFLVKCRLEWFCLHITKIKFALSLWLRIQKIRLHQTFRVVAFFQLQRFVLVGWFYALVA